MSPRPNPSLLPTSPPPYRAPYGTFPTSSANTSDKKRTSVSWGRLLLFTVSILWLVVVTFNIYAAYLRDDRTPEQRMRDRLDLEREQQERERERWQYERDQEAYRREMEKRERERREELEKLKYRQSPMYWQPPTREKCVQYATRQYSSRLWDMPDRFDWKKACLYLPITINNQVVEATSRCENHGSKGGIIGYWLINFDEPTCTPFWSDITDEGCSGLGTGMRRYKASLQSLYRGDDWPSICHTTPAVIEGITYANPTYCYDKDNWHGMWGIWEVEDSTCHGA